VQAAQGPRVVELVVVELVKRLVLAAQGVQPEVVVVVQQLVQAVAGEDEFVPREHDWQGDGALSWAGAGLAHAIL
jgi:hypothetical protein